MIKPFIRTNVKVVDKKTHEPTDYDYYVGRPSVFGNPYTSSGSKLAKYTVESREVAISSYRQYFYEQIENNTVFKDEIVKLLTIYKEYGRLNLVCWCKPKPCHADYIKEYLDNVLKNDININENR